MDLTSYASPSVALAVDLVNSYSPVWDREDLPDDQALGEFLDRHGISHQHPVSHTDLDQVRQLRRRLREVFMAADQESAVATLNGLLARAGALPHLTRHDGQPWHVHVTARRQPLASRLAAEAAMALAGAIAQHGFQRLRVCQGSRCLDVFVDTSRNGSRQYCSPAICGNRASQAAYRARHKAATTAPTPDPWVPQ